MYGASPAPVESRGAPHMTGLPAAVQAKPAAEGAAAASLPDISGLLEQALAKCRQEAASSGQMEPAAAGVDTAGHSGISVLIEQALAAGRQQEMVSAQGVATIAGEAAGGEIGLDQSIDVDAGRTSADRNTDQMQEEAAVRAAEGGASQEAMAPYRGRTVVEGVEGWMWEWREWHEVVPREPCPAGLEFHIDFATGTNRARLPDRLRALLDAAEAAGGGDADEQPLAPFPPQPESPPAVAAEGEGEGDVDVEDVEEEAEYGPGDSTPALMYEDDTGPDVYIGMDTDPANAPLLPMPTAVPPPPLGSCEQRH